MNTEDKCNKDDHFDMKIKYRKHVDRMQEYYKN